MGRREQAKSQDRSESKLAASLRSKKGTRQQQLASKKKTSWYWLISSHARRRRRNESSKRRPGPQGNRNGNRSSSERGGPRVKPEGRPVAVRSKTSREALEENSVVPSHSLLYASTVSGQPESNPPAANEWCLRSAGSRKRRFAIAPRPAYFRGVHFYRWLCLFSPGDAPLLPAWIRP